MVPSMDPQYHQNRLSEMQNQMQQLGMQPKDPRMRGQMQMMDPIQQQIMLNNIVSQKIE